MYTIEIISGKRKTFGGLRMPTDAEWIALHRARRMLKPRGGRETLDPKAHHAASDLLGKLFAGEGPREFFDGHEADEVLARLGLAVATGTDVADGDAALRVSVRLMVADEHGRMTRETAHALHMLTVKQVRELATGVEVVVPTATGVARWDNLRAYAEAYDSAVIETDGYDGQAVPIVHKRVVVDALFAAYDGIRRELGEAVACGESSQD